MPLTDTKLKKLKSEDKLYRVADFKGLAIEVKPSGVKVWRFRYRFEGKATMMSLGEYPIVTLAAARAKRDQARELLDKGINPTQYKREKQEARKLEAETLQAEQDKMVFNDLFLLWHKHNSETWTYSHARDIRERIDKHLVPQIGDLPLDDIKPMDMIHALKKIEQGGRVETTRRIKQYANRIFKFGIGFGHCERNPASELPNDIFIKAKPTNYAHTTDPKVLTQILNAIDDYAGDIVTKKALELAPYVFLRSKELAGLEWGEVDYERGVIEIPAERMKKKRTHLVPISSKVKEILEFMQTLSSDSKYIFPSPRTKSRPIGEQTLNPALHRLGFKNIQTFHGFRHTASTMLNEMGFMGDIIEKQLAHEETNKVRGAYNKAQYIDQRKEMMQAWADYLNGLNNSGNLVPFSKKVI
jgi:integrase